MGDEVELTKEQEADFKKMFAVFDKDKDNKLLSSELVDTIRALGLTPTQAEVQAMISEVDTNGDGTVDFDEFLSYAVRMLPEGGEQAQEEKLREAFQAWDKDMSGFLDADELRNAMMSMGDTIDDSEMDEFMKEAHPSSDGKINYEDFMIKLLKEYK